MFECPDNYDIFMAHEQEKEQRLARRPVCSYCDQPIQDNFFSEIDGENVCPGCLELHFCRTAEDAWVCSHCGKKIQDDMFYEIDCEKVCAECLDRDFSRTIDDVWE